MTPHILILNDASATPGRLRTAVLKLPFETVTNPVDQVEYSFIARADNFVQSAMGMMIARASLGLIHIRHCFARAMPEGIKVPHEIHNDTSMGQYSAHLYLNREPPSHTGTQFWTSPRFGDRLKAQDAKEYHLTSVRDFERSVFVEAKFNRLLIHDSQLWHSAEPTNGWGKDQHDGRLVLTAFFDRSI